MLQRLIYRNNGLTFPSTQHLIRADEESLWLHSGFRHTDTQTDTFGNRTGLHLDPIQLKPTEVYYKPSGPEKTSSCGVIYTEH